MPLPSVLAQEWSELLQNQARPESRWVSLATEGLDKTPSVRLVVWRGFDPERASLWLSTDAASAKMRELEANRRGAVLAWNAERKIQWRIACSFRAAVADEWTGKFPRLTAKAPASIDRQEAWKRHGQASRITFHWSEPGQPMTEKLAQSYKGGQARLDEDPDSPGDRFAVLEGSIKSVERLELAAPYHKRALFRADNEWKEERITA